MYFAEQIKIKIEKDIINFLLARCSNYVTSLHYFD